MIVEINLGNENDFHVKKSIKKALKKLKAKNIKVFNFFSFDLSGKSYLIDGYVIEFEVETYVGIIVKGEEFIVNKIADIVKNELSN